MPDIALPLLSRVEIASPCPAKWAEMTGDSVTRHCAQCDCNVHNISAMTTADAEAFLHARVGSDRTCVRLFRRTDGTILTQDCPVGIALWRKRARFAAGRVAAALLFLVTGGFVASARERDAFAGAPSFCGAVPIGVRLVQSEGHRPARHTTATRYLV